MTFIGRLLAHPSNGYIACALNGYIACACVFFLVSFTQLLECYPFFSSPISSQQPSILGLQWTLMPHYSTRNKKVHYKTAASFQFFPNGFYSPCSLHGSGARSRVYFVYNQLLLVNIFFFFSSSFHCFFSIINIGHIKYVYQVHSTSFYLNIKKNIKFMTQTGQP